MWFKVRGKRYVGDTHEALSRAYCEVRDASGEGASTFPTPTVYDDSGASVARLSYNGRVWGDKEWSPGDEPLYCPAWGRQ